MAHDRNLEELAETLWAERRVVEFLLYKLVAAKLILAADERRFVAPALDEVERVLDALKAAEVRRASSVEQLARRWGTSLDDVTLSELAQRAPEPLRSVFRDHQQAFAQLAEQIDETAAANRRLASSALSGVQEAIEALTGPATVATYTAAGRHDTPLTAPRRLDEVL